MKPSINFEHGHLTIELTPYQCARLAKACYVASDKSFDQDIDDWRTLSALFHACAVVCFTQWQMSQADLDELKEQLESLYLSHSDHDAGNDRRNGHNH